MISFVYLAVGLTVGLVTAVAMDIKFPVMYDKFTVRIAKALAKVL
jgi:hypothetical protein